MSHPPPSPSPWMPELPDTHCAMRVPAWWHPDATREDVSVLWRCRFRVDGLRHPGARWWFSGSQRVRVWLDGRFLAEGPSRSDPWRWPVRLVELPELTPGDHVLCAEVWHAGPFSGIGQMGPPAFLLAAAEDPDLDALLGGGAEWRCHHDRARSALRGHHWPRKRPYFPLGAGERFDAADHAWGWLGLDFDDAGWAMARKVCSQAGNPWGNLPLGARLVEDPLPPMARRPVGWARLVVADGVSAPDAEAWFGGTPLRVVPGQSARLVLERGGMTNAIPNLRWSGGQGTRIGLVWSEAGFDPETGRKGRRDTLEPGRELWGFRDEIHPDGGADREWTPPWFRSFRYLEITVETGEQPLDLGPCTLTETEFPLTLRARVEGWEASHQRMWTAAYDTLRLCSHETFFDCPQYEQAQFGGDTPVTARCLYWMANDDRLARKCIDDIHAGQLAGGLMQCRYPSRQVQILPTYGLQWVFMLEDFLRHRGDPGFLAPYLSQARAVVEWFLARRRPDGLPGRIPHAPFVDWASVFQAGNAPQDPDGGSAIIGAMLTRALTCLARLEQHAGRPELDPVWTREAEQAGAAVERLWDPERGLIPDTALRASTSIHAQVEAVLAGILDPDRARLAIGNALDADGVIQPGTFHFECYVLRALRAAGDRDRIRQRWPRWLDVLERTGLTTYPESCGDPRSDCHAWSSGIALSQVEDLIGLRVAPDAVGADRLEFDPDPQAPPLRATLGHPAGEVTVEFGLADADGRREAVVDAPAEIILPDGRRLEPGRHRVRVAPARRPSATE